MKIKLPPKYKIKAKWKEGNKCFVIAVLKINNIFLERTMFIFDGKTENPIYIIKIPYCCPILSDNKDR